MIATTNISKEEWLERIENAKRLLYSYDKADRRYLVDEIFLNRLFEIATTAIPVGWIKRYIAEEGIYPNRELLSVEQADAIERMIENWERENGTQI